MFTTAHAEASDWRAACEEVLDELGTGTGGALGFLYLTDALAPHSDRIVDRLREHTGVTHWTGTVGAGVCSAGRESYDGGALVAMVTDLDEESFRMIPPLGGSPEEYLEATRGWRERNAASVAVVHADPATADLPVAIERLAEGLEGGYLVGGLTSSGGRPVQIADRAVSGGLSGVLLSGRVGVVTGLSQGCELIAERHTITEARHNLVVTIDERPALEVLEEDIGPELAAALERLGGYLFVALPVPGSDTGDYLVRNLAGIDPSSQIVAIGDRAERGMTIQFARRDADAARRDLVRMVRDVRERAGDLPRGALYHTCLGRGRHQFGDDSAELRVVQDHLGDVPLAGFYGNGEIAHRRLYGYTGVLTVFGGG